MRTQRRTVNQAALALAVVAGLGAGATQVWATGIWDDETGDHTWNTPANWDNNAVPLTNSTNVAFNGAGVPQILVTGPIGANNFAASGLNYIIGEAGTPYAMTVQANCAFSLAAGVSQTVTINTPVIYSVGGRGRITNDSTAGGRYIFNGEMTFTPNVGFSMALNGAGTTENEMNGAINLAADRVLAMSSSKWLIGGANPNLLGTMSLTGGTLRLGNLNAFQNGTLNIGGGTFDLNAIDANVGRLIVGGGTVGLAGVTTGSINSATTFELMGGTINTVLAGIAPVNKTGSGTTFLAGANTYTSLTSVRGGTLTLNANALGSLVSTNALAIGGDGATFKLAGKNDNATSQTLGDVTVDNSGFSSTIDATAGTGIATAQLNLGAIHATTAGTTLNLTAGTGGSITTTQENTNGILGGRITFNTSDFAAGNGASTPIGAATYTALDTSAGTDTNNSLLTGSATLAGSRTTNSLKFNVTSAIGSLAIGDGNTLELTSGGLLYTGNKDYSITGGTLKSMTPGNSDLVVHQVNNTLTIDSVIADGNGASTLTKSGANTLKLMRANTYTGMTYVNQGTLVYGIDDAIATGGISISGNSTVTMGAFSDSVNNLTLVNGTISGTGTLTIAANGVVRLGNVDVALAGSGGIEKLDTGLVTLKKASTYAGATTVTAGTLAYGVGDVIGSGSVTVNGGTLDMKTFTDTVGAVSLTAGSITSTSNSGTLTSDASFNLDNGTVGVKLAGAAGITKNTTGTVTLTALNSQAGTTTVNSGTLIANVAVSAPTAPLIVNNTNTGAGNTTQFTAATSMTVGSLSGTIATPSSGTNNAWVAINGATSPANNILTVNQTVDATFPGAIRIGTGSANASFALGSGSTNKLTLTGVHNFNGTTTISGGTLAIAGAGNINSTSGITVNGGEFNYSTSVTLTKPLTLTSGTVSGTGTIGTALAIGTSGKLSPGNSPGTLTVNNATETWAGGGTYLWQLLDSSLVAGTGWDLAKVTGTGTVAVTATAGSPFTISLQTLSSIGPDVQGQSLNWNPLADQSWMIAQSGNAITGFDPAAFVLDSTNFVGAATGSAFSLALAADSKSLSLMYLAPGPVSRTWTGVGADLLWGTATNWSGDTTPAAGEIVSFTTAGLTSGDTVALNSAQSIGQLSFDSDNLTIGGTGSLSLSGATGVTVASTAVGTQNINVPVTILADSSWNIASTGGLTVNGTLSGANSLTKAGVGPMRLTGSLSGFTGNIAVSEGALRFAGSAVPTVARNALSVTGGTVQVEAGSGKALFVTSVLASGSGKIDITDGGMVVDYSGANPAATIQAYLASGYASGAWNGNGINSSTAAANAGMTLGMADNASLGLSTFGGGAVDSTSILVKYTYNGDLNFDGMVNGVDLSILGSSWQGTGLWANGDLNYDGTINGVDLSLLGANWQAGVAAPLNVSFAEAAGAMGMSVPEPASLAVVGLGTLALGLRRRRHA